MRVGLVTLQNSASPKKRMSRVCVAVFRGAPAAEVIKRPLKTARWIRYGDAYSSDVRI